MAHEPRENYSDAKALGAQVLSAFTALIDNLYPEGEQPSPLERERTAHEAFARSRASVYIGRQEYFDRLDGHVASNESKRSFFMINTPSFKKKGTYARSPFQRK